MNAQADLKLGWVHISEGASSDVVAHITNRKGKAKLMLQDWIERNSKPSAWSYIACELSLALSNTGRDFKMKPYRTI